MSTENKQPKEIKQRKLKDFSEGNKTTQTIITVCSIIGGFVLWHLIASVPSIHTFLSTPFEVVKAGISEAKANGRYWKDIGISLQRVLVGFGIAFLCAVPIAFLMGWYPKLRKGLEPWIQFFKSIPPIALIPLVVLAMGLSEKSKYTIIFITSFLVMVVTISQGIKEVDLTLVKAAYTFGARDNNLFFDVMIPASFPYILVAARLGISTALTTLIAAEMTGTIFGLGARIQGAQQFMNQSVVLLGIATIGIIGFILDRLLLLLEKKLTRWK